MPKILFINLADETTGSQTLESFSQLSNTECIAPPIFRLAQAFVINEQPNIPEPITQILQEQYDLIIIESHGFLDNNNHCCSKFNEQADGLPIGNQIDFTPEQLALFIDFLLPNNSTSNPSRTVHITLAICYGARGIPWNIDHSDPNINFNTIDSFATRFLTAIKTLLLEKKFYLGTLTAFTGEVSFSREIPGAPLVQSEQSILTHIPRLILLNQLLNTSEENIANAHDEHTTRKTQQEFDECLRQRDEVGRQILTRRTNYGQVVYKFQDNLVMTEAKFEETAEAAYNENDQSSFYRPPQA